MKIKSVNLETVCGITSKMPENDKLEVAFAGRSNVGKSTLINGLMNRKSLARTSSQPGKTQTVNFYNINDGSKVLRLIFLLVDIRHKPNQNDLQMYEWCTHYGFNPIIIATKADKIKRSQKAKQIKQIKETLQVVEGTPVIPYSSMTKEGREEIWEYIDMVYEEFSQEQDLQSE